MHMALYELKKEILPINIVSYYEKNANFNKIEKLRLTNYLTMWMHMMHI